MRHYVCIANVDILLLHTRRRNVKILVLGSCIFANDE